MPAPEPNPQRGSIAEIMERNGVTRRSFLQRCAFISGVLALPAVPWAQQIASALSTKPRLPVIWLNAQDCNGNIGEACQPRPGASRARSTYRPYSAPAPR